MKAVVMCAGKGTRMLPLTEKTNKVLLEVNGKPFLYYLLTNLKKAGFDEIALVVGYLKEQFQPFLEKFGFDATLIEQKEQLGTGHAIEQVQDFVGEDKFLVVGGDNLWSVEDMKKINFENNNLFVTGIKNDHPELYGALVTRDSSVGDEPFLVSIVEKPKEHVSDLISTGMYKFTSEIFSALKGIEKSSRGEYEIVDAIQKLADNSRVRVYELEDYWMDLGKPEDIPVMEKFLKDNFEE